MRKMDIRDDTLTLDKMLLAGARLGLGGIKVQVSPLIKPVAKIQISHDFKYCSDDFRTTFNYWLEDTFGTKEVCYMFNRDTILVSPEQAAALKLAT